jgi:hypothetical protein
MWAAGVEAIGLLEQEARHHRDDQRRAQRVEGVAEGKDVGLVCTENLIRIYRLTESAKLAR